MMKHGSTSSQIFVVNPNSTASMTRKIDQAAQRCRADKTQVVTVNPLNTPASIDGGTVKLTRLRAKLKQVGGLSH